MIQFQNILILWETTAGAFEAYVGGLYSDYGLEGYITTIRPWLHTLLTPYIEKAYDQVLAQHPVSDPVTTKGLLFRFNQSLYKIGKVPTWEENVTVIHDSKGEAARQWWEIRAIVDGKVIGIGSGLTKKEAMHIAAGHALETMAKE
jgi:dsRNA-specific ribonuclease